MMVEHRRPLVAYFMCALLCAGVIITSMGPGERGFPGSGVPQVSEAPVAPGAAPGSSVVPPSVVGRDLGSGSSSAGESPDDDGATTGNLAPGLDVLDEALGDESSATTGTPDETSLPGPTAPTAPTAPDGAPAPSAPAGDAGPGQSGGRADGDGLGSVVVQPPVGGSGSGSGGSPSGGGSTPDRKSVV